MKKEVEIGLLTPRGLGDANDGLSFLRLLLQAAPSFIPERYGNWEPLAHSFVQDELPAVVGNAWKDPFLWSRSRPKLQGSLWMGRGCQHTSLHLRTQFQLGLADELWTFFKSAAEALEADFGYFHVFTERQIDREEEPQQTVIPFRQGLSTHDLRRCLPDLSWGNVFGRPYVALFGLERLLSSPAASVERIGQDLVCMKATDHIQDLVADPDSFMRIREHVKAHLNSDAFYRSESSGFRTPEFSWS